MISCSTNGISPSCSLELRYLGINVSLPNEVPADSVNIEIRLKDTGKLFDPCEGSSIQEGCSSQEGSNHYLVFTDEFNDILTEGETTSLIVIGTKGEYSFLEEFEIGFDGCHFTKVSGSTAVTMTR